MHYFPLSRFSLSFALFLHGCTFTPATGPTIKLNVEPIRRARSSRSLNPISVAGMGCLFLTVLGDDLVPSVGTVNGYTSGCLGVRWLSRGYALNTTIQEGIRVNLPRGRGKRIARFLGAVPLGGGNCHLQTFASLFTSAGSPRLFYLGEAEFEEGQRTLTITNAYDRNATEITTKCSQSGEGPGGGGSGGGSGSGPLTVRLIVFTQGSSRFQNHPINDNGTIAPLLHSITGASQNLKQVEITPLQDGLFAAMGASSPIVHAIRITRAHLKTS